MASHEPNQFKGCPRSIGSGPFVVLRASSLLYVEASCVTCLQSAYVLSGGEGGEGHIQENLSEMVGLPPANIIQSLFKTLQTPGSCFEDLEKAVTDIMLEGYAAQHVMGALLTDIIAMDNKHMSELHKAEIAIKIAEVDKKLIDGADELLQLLMVCSLIMRCFKSNV